MKFSVAMCTYNGSHFVAEQLQSLAAQTRKPDELIICDDGSTDDTVSIIRNFATEAPFTVQLTVNQRNLGSTKNFEQAIGLCTGDLIALCDQDDVWLEQKLARTEALLASRPQVGAVFTDAEMVDDKLNALDQRLWVSIGFDERKQHKVRVGQALRLLIDGNFVTGATLTFRAKFRDLLLPIPRLEETIHDAWIVLLIAAVAQLDFIEQPMVLYRQHSAQQLGIDPEDYAPINWSKDISPHGVIDAVSRRTSFATEIKKCRTLRERLTQCSQHYDCRSALAQVERKLVHFETRNNISGEKLARLRQVLRELVTLRYHSYSRGFKSAAKDLFA
ncbi:MAG TPA: glycosyltransferase family 2 protein [Pyrinomonadaceae bacterium]|nr:glycosyltransferase family 2 protein [Pyrinomonadaceae bacterium]